MKKSVCSILFLIAFAVAAQQKDYAIQAVDFTQVKLTDKFWLPRIETNRTVTIPASFARCESTGRVKNFVMAAKKEGKFCTVYPFDDTDIYKTIEGASYSLATYPDKKLEAYMDNLITIIGNAQEPDGYLYTARTIDPQHPHKWAGMQRWEKERELSHELYNAGHLYEAAAAHYLATQKKTLLNVALKNADLVCSVYGVGKMSVAPGHEIVEMGLVKLFRLTGKQEYLNTAIFFIAARGQYKYDTKSKDSWKNGSYWQDHKPVVDQDEAVGHAVRAAYLYAAVADVAALTGNDSLLKAIDKIWQNTVEKKMYVQGSIGAKSDGERFGENYELPNATAYNETCAAIANVFWNQRMFLLHGDSKYIDILEKSLYNGLISGIGLDGKSFFYTNAMQIKGHNHIQGASNGFTAEGVEVARSGWFECSCCPTNLVRLIPSIAGYMYAVNNETAFINLFINSTAIIKVDTNNIELIQQNNYPWDGDLKFIVNPSKSAQFNVAIRIPGWAMNKAMPTDLYSFEDDVKDRPVLKINGQIMDYAVDKGYAIIA
ncbi:MAG: glycoside hydrolase family 127 protein, partial [Chitinophagaceae bacterium]|nr:glycoside hydrolase family 127 protein [Chitinophagaceae bacterium]